VADISKHLTPRTLASELEKLRARVPVILHHLKPPCVEQIRREVESLGRPEIQFVEQGRTYVFD
ncbi:MAG: 3',5'-cyclic-nucleotide phosphodiesterase, partial [Acidobacteria bacterium]|nr:3',5'-cyclic-nucleotide phosphodiesterase [Acidobacteriota bacterium]